MVKKEVKPSHSDSESNLNLFDRNKLSAFSETHCVVPALSELGIEEYWSQYLIKEEESDYHE